MYINSNMTDAEILACTHGTASPLVRQLSDRLIERNREIAELNAWADKLEKVFVALGAVIDA